MPLVAAYLVPGSPLPYLRRDVAPWAPLVAAHAKAAQTLAAAAPEVLLVYSTQWIAVLDQLWQTRPRSHGLHVDENWYEFGDLPFDIRIDTAVAAACIAGSAACGVRAKGVDYDGFPIDTGTIVANGFLNSDSRASLVIAANNVYHDWRKTEQLAALAASSAEQLGRRYAVIGIGGLSGTIFREDIALERDHIARTEDDELNRRLLDRLAWASADEIRTFGADYAAKARADMGMKHLAWILGALGERYHGATTLGYGPTYGSGAAVVEFKV
ncbi:MAG: tRNA U-34 5-methylaminomethyl-2-thiouridine biosynthesis protein [Gammaproteobacteria bacterium]|nr:tRNA U-34 5-methylaminomethyl-2-thiouridine biosynthesis protein [Gammaproteobacteria bacterium]